MTNINYELNRLINFALQNNLICEEDVIYSSNMLISTLGLDDFEPVNIDETLSTATEILENILDFAVEKNLLDNTTTERDLFDTKIMNCLMPRPSEVISKFNELYSISPEDATKYYYDLSIASNYIRKDRIDKNVIWKTKTPYGESTYLNLKKILRILLKQNL